MQNALICVHDFFLYAVNQHLKFFIICRQIFFDGCSGLIQNIFYLKFGESLAIISGDHQWNLTLSMFKSNNCWRIKRWVIYCMINLRFPVPDQPCIDYSTKSANPVLEVTIRKISIPDQAHNIDKRSFIRERRGYLMVWMWTNTFSVSQQIIFTTKLFCVNHCTPPHEFSSVVFKQCREFYRFCLNLLTCACSRGHSEGARWLYEYPLNWKNKLFFQWK